MNNGSDKLDEIRVSVVVPTYNRKNLLKKCIISLLNQNYSKDKYEIIIIDGESNDGTENIVKELIKQATCELKYFRQKNKGIAAARNLGIKNSKGQIIAFTDSDCLPEKNWLLKISEAFNSPSVGGVYGKVEASNSNLFLVRVLMDSYLRKSWEKQSMNNIAIRRSYAQRVMFDERSFPKAYEDVDFVLRCEQIFLKENILFKKIDSYVLHRATESYTGIIKLGYRSGLQYISFIKKHFILKYFFLMAARQLLWFFLPALTLISLLFLKNISVYLIATLILFGGTTTIRSSMPVSHRVILAPLIYFLMSFGFIIGVVKSLSST